MNHIFQQIFFTLVLTFSSLPSSELSRVLYLMQSGNLSLSLQLYREYVNETGEHDLETIQRIGLMFLDRGRKSNDPEIQLLTLFGAGISLNEEAQYILEDSIQSGHPQLQLIALNFLARFHNDSAIEILNRAMTSPFLPIRLEAAYQLAIQKHPKAVGQIESLMQKVPSEIHSLFPQLFAIAGDASAIKALQRLMAHPKEEVRIEAILSAAKHGRDDLLPDIRRLSTHHTIAQQEACAAALGLFQDEYSFSRLQQFAGSPALSVRLAALEALFLLGRENIRQEIETIAKDGNLFAIAILGNIPGSEILLRSLAKSQPLSVRVNAALALLELGDPSCLPALYDVLLIDSRDLAFMKIHSFGQALEAIKVIPSARQNLEDNSIAGDLSLHFREAVLEKTLALPEKAFLALARTLFDKQQADLIPLLSRLLETLQSKDAIALLMERRDQVGAPLVRNCCNLALYRLKEPGPYREALQRWLSSQQDVDLIQFRPFIPSDRRDLDIPHYQLTPQDTSLLLVEAFESLVQTQDQEGINLLLEAIHHGNEKNRYALAGLLMRAAH
ncbi:MAG: HEAT repeat domain-containing protein [Waddliaceae bacterium]